MTDVTTPLLSGLLSGVAVATLNYLFTRKKTNAEIARTNAEIAKINAEIPKTNAEITKLTTETEKLRLDIATSTAEVSATVSYSLSGKSEEVIYDSTKSEIGFDFRGTEAEIWQLVDGKDTPVSPKGRGSLDFENGGILNLQRTNTDGRYEIRLNRYMYGGSERTAIPRNDLIPGTRNIRVSFEAKVVGGEHTLSFILRNEVAKRRLGTQSKQISQNTWTPLSVYFQVPPSEECYLRIDDEQVTQAPSSVQIRNLVVAERVSS